MALEGSITDFGLADILQLIYFQRKTGVLTLAGKLDRVRLLFVEGNITGAESKRRLDDNRLGKILLKRGFIKDTDLQVVLDEQKKTGKKIGAALIEKGLVAQSLVHEILTSQITETVIQLFSWKQGTYEFESQGMPQDKERDLSLDTQHLLMEGLRIVDEWSVIKGKISLDTLFRKTGDDISGLSDDEQEIFSFVDGENDVSTIIDLTGKDNFVVSKTLLTLAEKGVIESIEFEKTLEEAGRQEKASALNIINYLAPASIVVSVLLSFLVMLLLQGGFIREYKASIRIEEMRTGIQTYKIEKGAYPDTLDLVSTKKDPWGRPYLYRKTEQSFTLTSAGADGREGTADDIF